MLEITAPIVLNAVMITVLTKYRPKGMALTASTKFCQRNVWGHMVGGMAVSSVAVLNAVMTIQYRGMRKKMVMTIRKILGTTFSLSVRISIPRRACAG